jgi:hypothetical protein
MRSVLACRVLSRICRELEAKFYIDDRLVSSRELFGPNALLPVLAFHASVRANYLLGANLGIDFRSDDNSLLGVYADIPPIREDSASVIRMLFLMNSLKTIFGVHPQEGGCNILVECTPVYERYRDGLLSAIAGRSETAAMQPDAAGDFYGQFHDLELQWPLAKVFPAANQAAA